MDYIINNFGNCVVNYNNTIWHNKWLYKSIQVQSNSFSKKKKKFNQTIIYTIFVYV